MKVLRISRMPPRRRPISTSERIAIGLGVGIVALGVMAAVGSTLTTEQRRTLLLGCLNGALKP